MNKILAFDPATTTGWAFRNTGWKIQSGVIVGTDLLEIMNVIGQAKQAGCHAAVLEDCYFGPNTSQACYRKLAGIQQLIRSACESQGITVRIVRAVTWQSVLSVGGKQPKKREDIKRLSLWVAKHETGHKLSQDASDAVCILLHAERSARLAPFQGQQQTIRYRCGTGNNKKG